MGNDACHFARCVGIVLCLCLVLNNMPARAEDPPPALKNIGIDAKLGAPLPLDLAFVDETGKPVTLGQYFNHGHPVILALVYFECPMLCTLVLNNLTEGMKGLPWTPGQEFEVVAVSFNPADNAALARAKKETYLKEYGRPQGAAGWHFLTGKDEPIKALANAVGFKYAWDPVARQFAHATGIFVFTPEGKCSRVLFGVDYPSHDLRLALTEAAGGKIGSISDKLILFCYHYDPQKGYSLAAMRIIQIAGTLTVIFVAGIIGSFLLLERRRLRLQPALESNGTKEKNVKLSSGKDEQG